MSAARTFEVVLPDDIHPEQGLRLAREKARRVGISIDGDGSGGTFTGPAQGTYRVDGRTLSLVVEKKPAFVPWSMIERGMQKLQAELRPATGA